jgi:hypothetical protein
MKTRKGPGGLEPPTSINGRVVESGPEVNHDMTNDRRSKALKKLEMRYARLSAQAAKLVGNMSRQPIASVRARLRKRLRIIDKQRTAIYGQMDSLWKSA